LRTVESAEKWLCQQLMHEAFVGTQEIVEMIDFQTD